MYNYNNYLFIYLFILSILISNTLSISTPPIDDGHIVDGNGGEIHHNCIHDKLEEKHFKNTPRLESDHHLKSVSAILPTHPIKIVYNTTFLGTNQNEPQTCYSVNQQVTLGGSPGSSLGPCSTVGKEPCTYTCTAADVLTADLSNLIQNKVLTNINTILEKYLTVSNRPEVNSYPQIFQCVEEYDIDIRRGFTGDFMIYVSAHPTVGSNTIAYATSCLTYSTTGAPFLGIINFNPKFFSPYTDPNYLNNNIVGWTQFIRVGIHETIHALGFSNGMYKNFRNPATGLKYTSSISSTQSTSGTSPSGASYTVTRYFINTPTVSNYISKHFGCNNIPYGAELENVGGSGTAGSHWKANRFGEEMMLGYAAPVAPLTGLTLALLYDSGWYGIINQDSIEQSSWGKGKGCSFINDFCSQTSWKFTGYWPSTATVASVGGSVRGCSATRVGKGSAYWGQGSSPLATSLQHFNDPTVGGGSSVFEYCLYNSPDQYCFDTSLKPSVEGEVFGPSSACFTEKNTKGISMGCRPQRCENGQLQLQYGNTWFNCSAGTNVTLTATTTVICPDENDNTCDPLPTIPTTGSTTSTTTGGSSATTGSSTTNGGSTTAGKPDGTTSSTTDSLNSASITDRSSFYILLFMIVNICLFI